MKIEFTSQVFKERKMFVAHSPELDISSCATTERKALANLQEGSFSRKLNGKVRSSKF